MDLYNWLVSGFGIALSVALFVGITVGVVRWAGVSVAREVVFAVLRAVGQLAIVSLFLSFALTLVWVGVVMIAVMLVTAIVTAWSRLRTFEGALVAMTVAIVSGAAVSLVTVFAAGAFELSIRYALAFAGIVLGGSMNAASATGRHLWLGMVHRADEIEGWLALGATPRRAVADIARSAVQESLRPAIDQTKTTGLVTLPGAFVGALLAGASPVEAGAFQVTVVAGLLAARAISGVITAQLLGAPRLLPSR